MATKVCDLEVGDCIKFNKTVAYVVEIKPDRVMLSKKRNGVGMFHEDVFSHRFPDLMNRVERIDHESE